MTTVTGITAARAQQIEDESIVNGVVTAGHLILTRHDGGTIDAGSVVGPTGPTGPAGPTSIAIVTSGTRPAHSNGLAIYETDTKRLYISDGAAWNYRGGLWICTSSTRPASPFNGLMIYETDTKLLWVYDGAAWQHKGGTIICTSGTRPASPFVGMQIYETDTGKTLVYQSAATGWTPPWGSSWGLLAIGSSSTDQGGIIGEIDITGVTTGAFTYVANRRIEVEAYLPIQRTDNAAGGMAIAKITDAANVQLAASKETFIYLNEEHLMIVKILPFISVAGSKTYKARLLSSTGTYSTKVAGYGSAFIKAVDLGPAGAPV